jgi:hypothetical protein
MTGWVTSGSAQPHAVPPLVRAFSHFSIAHPGSKWLTMASHDSLFLFWEAAQISHCSPEGMLYALRSQYQCILKHVSDPTQISTSTAKSLRIILQNKDMAEALRALLATTEFRLERRPLFGLREWRTPDPGDDGHVRHCSRRPLGRRMANRTVSAN